ncbi:MAG: HEAT repeat domain-containing protein [Myxococcota bacterium]|nr:HEAT repeat domain-containing protein [Myxococcota bacterium]
MRKNIVTTLCIGSLLVGCRADVPAEAEPAPLSPSPPATQTVAHAPDPLDSSRQHLTALKDKQRCNRVMGCEPAIALLQLGSAVVPALLDALAQQPLDGRYWQLRVITLLGQLGDARALSPLHEALTQPRWEVRARSALALAAIADTRSLEPLRALLRRGHDLATDGAALHALKALNDTIEARSPHDVLADRLPTEEAPLAQLNPGHFAFLAELVGVAQLRAGLPLARWGVLHRDRFTRMAALKTLAQLRDRDGIPYAMTRLDDPSPGVRRQTLRTLRVITGRRAFTKAEHWRDWCEQRRCLEPIRGLSGSSGTGGAVQPGREDAGAGHVGRDEDDLGEGDHREERRAGPKGQD